MDKPKGVYEKGGRCAIRYYVDGKQYYEVTPHPYTGAGVREAARLRRRRIEEGFVKADEIEIPFFSQVAQSWLDSTDLTPAARRVSKGVLMRHWMPTLHDRRIDKIRYMELAQLIGDVDVKPKTKRNIVSVLRSVFNLAIKSGYITSNPADGFRKAFKAQKPDIDPFTREERDQLLELLEGDARLFYAIRFYTGLRPGEVIALTWGDYDGLTFAVEKQHIEGVRRSTTKTHNARRVDVHPFIRSMLREHPTRFAGGHILAIDGHAYGRSNEFPKVFRAACETLGIRHRSPYNCRHTCASMMLEAGADPAYCAKQLGHSLEMFFSRYARWINEDRDAIERAKVEQYL